MLQQLKNIYRALPPWSTAFLKYIPDGLLFGKSFRDCVPRTDIACVGPNLKRTLDYARQHTIWGREHIPIHITENDAEKIVTDLPCVESSDIIANPRAFMSDEVTRSNAYWTTTGMTKIPTSVCLANNAYGLEWAHMFNIWARGGYCRRKDLKLTFRGYRFNPGELVRFDPIYNELSVDSFQITDKTFMNFLNLIRKKKISCIHGYPTLIKLFKDRLQKFHEIFTVREIMLASEGASAGLKCELASFFSAHVISWYGLTEKVVLAYDENANSRFVNFTSYGYPRIVNADSSGIGEIVGTTFVNFAMPLINYRTGDSGRVLQTEEQLVIEQLEGRSNKDFVYVTKNEKYSLTAIGAPDEVYRKMLFFQVIQNQFANLEVLLLLRKEWKNERKYLRELLESSLREKLPAFHIAVRLADNDSEFERSGRGKLRKLVQNLKEV